MKKKRTTAVAAVILILVVLPLISYYFLKEGEKLRSERHLPEFTLPTIRGDSISNEDLQGNVHVATFLYTRCGWVCDSLMNVMSRLQQKFSGEEEFRLVTYTIDPDFDTDSVFGAYAGRFNADQDQWTFVRGTQKQIFDLSLIGYFGKVEKHEHDIPKLKADEKIALVKRNGDIYGYYSVIEPKSLRKLEATIKELLGESRQ